MTTAQRERALHYTGDPAADHLLAEDPLALLIGMVLDQQVRMEKAFRGPYDLRERLGHLDAPRIARMDPAKLDEVFRARPALHRFPGTMARRVQAMSGVVAKEYGGDASRIWKTAPDGATLAKRLRALPGLGEPKVKTLIAILGKRFAIRPPGWEKEAIARQSLGDVDSPEALAKYRESKRLWKAQSAQSSPRRPQKRKRAI